MVFLCVLAFRPHVNSVLSQSENSGQSGDFCVCVNKKNEDLEKQQYSKKGHYTNNTKNKYRHCCSKYKISIVAPVLKLRKQTQNMLWLISYTDFTFANALMLSVCAGRVYSPPLPHHEGKAPAEVQQQVSVHF